MTTYQIQAKEFIKTKEGQEGVKCFKISKKMEDFQEAHNFFCDLHNGAETENVVEEVQDLKQGCQYIEIQFTAKTEDRLNPIVTSNFYLKVE